MKATGQAHINQKLGVKRERTLRGTQMKVTAQMGGLTIQEIEDWYAHANHALNNITVGQFRDLCDLALKGLSLESVRSEALHFAEALGKCQLDVKATGSPPHWPGNILVPDSLLLRLDYFLRALSLARVAEGRPPGIKARRASTTKGNQMNTSKPSAPESPAKEPPIAAPQDRVAGDDRQSLSSGATSRSTPSGESPAVAASIRALLGEARGYLEGLELADRIDAALAAKEQPGEVASMVKRLNEAIPRLTDVALSAYAKHRTHLHECLPLLSDAAALLAKLGQGWIPTECPLCQHRFIAEPPPPERP